MNKADIVAFFDELAPKWDEGLIHDDEKINRIFDYADIGSGMRVLDVACGTGVLFPDYLKRNVEKVTGIDLSEAMIARARAKFDDPRICLMAADVEEAVFEEPFDRCMVYNAFPHFPDPALLIGVLANALVPGGRLTVAHGKSREEINGHHAGVASAVSRGLPHEEELAMLFQQHFDTDVIVADSGIYVVSGIKR